MLPFLKRQQEAAISSDENQSDSYSALDAIVDDIAQFLESKDKSLLKSALEALCEYIKEEDIEQDKQLDKE